MTRRESLKSVALVAASLFGLVKFGEGVAEAQESPRYKDGVLPVAPWAHEPEDEPHIYMPSINGGDSCGCSECIEDQARHVAKIYADAERYERSRRCAVGTIIRDDEGNRYRWNGDRFEDYGKLLHLPPSWASLAQEGIE